MDKDHPISLSPLSLREQLKQYLDLINTGFSKELRIPCSGFPLKSVPVDEGFHCPICINKHNFYDDEIELNSVDTLTYHNRREKYLLGQMRIATIRDVDDINKQKHEILCSDCGGIFKNIRDEELLNKELMQKYYKKNIISVLDELMDKDLEINIEIDFIRRINNNWYNITKYQINNTATNYTEKQIPKILKGFIDDDIITLTINNYARDNVYKTNKFIVDDYIIVLSFNKYKFILLNKQAVDTVDELLANVIKKGGIKIKNNKGIIITSYNRRITTYKDPKEYKEED